MPISKNSQNNFSSLNIQDLIDTFNLKTVDNLAFLSESVSELQKTKIAEICQVSTQEIDTWNEQELIIKHISLILNTAKMEGPSYNTFAERSFCGKVDEIELGGIVDFLVARGRFQPREPYFFLQEYKKKHTRPKQRSFSSTFGGNAGRSRTQSKFANVWSLHCGTLLVFCGFARERLQCSQAF